MSAPLFLILVIAFVGSLGYILGRADAQTEGSALASVDAKLSEIQNLTGASNAVYRELHELQQFVRSRMR